MSRDVCGVCWCPIDNEGCGCVPKQPEALRLADELLDSMNDEHWSQLNADAATELRRLHAENEALKAAQHDCGFGTGCCYQAAKSEADEVLLRQALEALYAIIPDVHDWYGEHEHKAHKAIAALKERLK